MIATFAVGILSGLTFVTVPFASASPIVLISDSHFSGKNVNGITRTPSYVWVLTTPTSSSSGLTIQLFDASDNSYVTSTTFATSTCNSAPDTADPLPTIYGSDEAIIFSCTSLGSTSSSLQKYAYDSGVIIHVADYKPCNINKRIHMTDANDISFACSAEHTVGVMHPSSMSDNLVVALNYINDKCDSPIVSSYDEANDVMIVLCGGDNSINLYDKGGVNPFSQIASFGLSNTVTNLDDMDCSIALGRCVYIGKTVADHRSEILQYNFNNDKSSANFTDLGFVGGSSSKFSAFVTDFSSIGSIEVSGRLDKNIEFIGLNRNATVNPILLGTISCTVVLSICVPLELGGPTYFYHASDNELIYSGTKNGHGYLVLNITSAGFEQATNNDNSMNGGNIGGGDTGEGDTGTPPVTTTGCSTNGQQMNITQVGNLWWQCVTRTDNPDVKNNGFGFIVFILGIIGLVAFLAYLKKSAHLEIHPIIWILGAFAVLGLVTALGFLDIWYIVGSVALAIVGISFTVWKRSGGDSSG